ncbi:MAG: YlxR family protein [Anaerolineae bacterium]|nr:YlxR family protein [Thermoflexales bacterium]MDW8396364.1 YlxR family protein [Anaerolineae bacterium]
MTQVEKKRSGRRVHVPMRMCIGTRTTHPKRDLVRLVRTEDGHIVVDPTGKRPGSRGAYLCKSRQAAELAIKHKRLEAVFGHPLSKEDEQAILAFFSQFDS